MLLSHVGETCTTDFHDLLALWYKNFEDKQLDNQRRGYRTTRLTRQIKQEIHDFIAVVYNDFLDFNIKWAKRWYLTDVKELHERLGPLGDEFSNPLRLISQTRDRVADHLTTHLDLPTWHHVDIHMRSGFLRIELGPDERLLQWEKEHGHEYRR